jgi:hypothetical protein
VYLPTSLVDLRVKSIPQTTDELSSTHAIVPVVGVVRARRVSYMIKPLDALLSCKNR